MRVGRHAMRPNGDNFILSYTKFNENPLIHSRVVECLKTETVRLLQALDSNAPSNLSKIGYVQLQ